MTDDVNKQDQDQDQMNSTGFLSHEIEKTIYAVMEVVPDKTLNTILSSLMTQLAKTVAMYPEGQRENVINEVAGNFSRFAKMACDIADSPEDALNQNAPTTVTEQ